MESITKICQTCLEGKPLGDFKKEPRCQTGFTPHCKQCINKKKKEYRQRNHKHCLQLESRLRQTEKSKATWTEWWEKNRDIQLEKARKRYRNNPTPYLLRSKKQRESDPVAYKAYLHKWNLENRKWYRDKYHSVLKHDIDWKIKNNLRGSLRKALNGQVKTCSALKYLGCSMEFFRGYMESKFRDGMTWNNHGQLWHIDHILPCRSFDMSRETDRANCFHYTNLQPLLIAENLSKQDRLPRGSFARNTLTSNRNVVL